MAEYTWDHVHLRTANPEATAQWYERMLGAEVLRSMQQGKPRIDLKIGGAPLTLYLVHFKSMGSPRNGLDGREATMPIRIAEAQAVRRIIEERFGKDHAADKRWAICARTRRRSRKAVRPRSSLPLWLRSKR